MLFRKNTFVFKVIVLCLVSAGAIWACKGGQGGSSPGKRLDKSFNSVEKLTEEFLVALQNEDLQTMKEIAANQEEFERLLWPHLPASRPGTNLTPEFVWRQSQIQSLSSLRSTMDRYKGSDLNLIRVELSGEVRDYGELKLFMEPVVIVSVEGVEKKVDLFGAVMRLDGEYKIYSYSL